MKFTPCCLGIFNVNRVFCAIAQNFSIRRGNYIFHCSLTLQIDYLEKYSISTNLDWIKTMKKSNKA